MAGRTTADATLAERLGARAKAAFRREEREGLRLAMRARLAALVAIAVWLPVQLPLAHAAYYLGVVALFALLAAALLALSSSPALYRLWLKYAFALIESLLLVYVLLTPPPVHPHPMPAALTLRFDTFGYLFVFLASAALTTSPRLVLWTGATLAAAWGAGVAWIVARPGTQTDGDGMPASDAPVDQILAFYLDPNYVDVFAQVAQVVVLLIVTGTLAAAVARARGVARRQMRAERERANLARHFSPNVVDALASSSRLLGPGRSQPVAVLFADIVGFTSLCATMRPEEVIDLLRAFHRLTERAVFDRDGTLDKYIGDGLMATFGTPTPGPRDATNALRCARALVEATDGWSRERQARGLPPVRIGVGAHYGPVLLGEVGGERVVEFTVTGDTVNVASRLENLTRALAVDVAVSEDLARRALAEGGGAAALAGFHTAPPQLLRGRTEPLAIRIWRLHGPGRDGLAAAPAVVSPARSA